jgi:hypothetical protein
MSGSGEAKIEEDIAILFSAFRFLLSQKKGNNFESGRLIISHEGKLLSY